MKVKDILYGSKSIQCTWYTTIVVNFEYVG